MQVSNDPGKRECVGRLFEERALDVLVVEWVEWEWHWEWVMRVMTKAACINADKSKVMSVWENVEPSLLKIMLNGERMEVVNSFLQVSGVVLISNSNAGITGTCCINSWTSTFQSCYSVPLIIIIMCVLLMISSLLGLRLSVRLCIERVRVGRRKSE